MLAGCGFWQPQPRPTRRCHPAPPRQRQRRPAPAQPCPARFACLRHAAKGAQLRVGDEEGGGDLDVAVPSNHSVRHLVHQLQAKRGDWGGERAGQGQGG